MRPGVSHGRSAGLHLQRQPHRARRAPRRRRCRSKRSTGRPRPLQCSAVAAPDQARPASGDSPLRLHEPRAQLEQAHVALPVPAVVRDSDRPARAAATAAARRTAPTAGWRWRPGRRPTANSRADFSLDERERHALAEPGRRRQPPQRAVLLEPLVGSRRRLRERRERGGQAVVAVVARDLLDQVDVARDVDAPRGHRHHRVARGASSAEHEARGPRGSADVVDARTSAPEHARRRARSRAARCVGGRHRRRRRRSSRARTVPAPICSISAQARASASAAAAKSAPRSKRYDASVDRPRRLLVRRIDVGLEPGALERDRRRRRRHFAVAAAHDAGQRLRASRSAITSMSGVERALLAVERRQRLAGPRRADAQLGPAEPARGRTRAADGRARAARSW